MNLIFGGCSLIAILTGKLNDIMVSTNLDIEGNWTLKETKVYISSIHSTYYIQFSYFASHQLFIAGMGNEMLENRAAAKESS